MHFIIGFKKHNYFKRKSKLIQIKSLLHYFLNFLLHKHCAVKVSAGRLLSAPPGLQHSELDPARFAQARIKSLIKFIITIYILQFIF